MPKNARSPAKPASKPAAGRAATGPAKPGKAGRGSAPKTLSPRGRGSVDEAEDDWLRDLFAENMRRVRLHRAYSQDALADLCDLDRTYIGSVERKRRNISIRNVQRIAVALEVDVRVLFDPLLSKDDLFGD